MKELIEFVCHVDVDPELAADVMAEYGGLFLNTIEVQLAARRAPFLAFRFECEDGSLLICAGNRDFARKQGIQFQCKKATLFAIVMPLNCDQATRIQQDILADPRAFTCYPDADCN